VGRGHERVPRCQTDALTRIPGTIWSAR
jgi:hypothetical protein